MTTAGRPPDPIAYSLEPHCGGGVAVPCYDGGKLSNVYGATSIGSGISSGLWSSWNSNSGALSDRSLAQLSVSGVGVVPLDDDLSDSWFEPWFVMALRNLRCMIVGLYRTTWRVGGYIERGW